MSQYLGIDFGTSFFRAAIQKENRAERVPLQLSDQQFYLIADTSGFNTQNIKTNKELIAGFSFTSVKQKLGLEDSVQTNKGIVQLNDLALKMDWFFKDRCGKI